MMAVISFIALPESLCRSIINARPLRASCLGVLHPSSLLVGVIFLIATILKWFRNWLQVLNIGHERAAIWGAHLPLTRACEARDCHRLILPDNRLARAEL